MLEKTYEELDFYIERRRFSDAENLLSSELKEHPDDELLLYYSAFIDYQFDQYGTSKKTLLKLLERNPNSYEARSLLFQVELEQENHAEAEKWIISLLEDYPQSSDFYADYSKLMLNTLFFDKAEKLAAESIRLNPENEKALFNMSLINIINNKGSNNELTKLLNDHPDQTYTISILLTYLLDQNKIKEARNITIGALRADPNNSYFLNMAKELKYLDHWSMRPVTWLGKYGMKGAIGLWIGIVILSRIERNIENPSFSQIITPLFYIYIVFCIYTWVYPTIFKKLFFRD